MARMVSKKRFTSKPEGKIEKGAEFDTERPEWFAHLGIAKVIVKKKRASRARRSAKA